MYIGFDSQMVKIKNEFEVTCSLPKKIGFDRKSILRWLKLKNTIQNV